MQRELLKWVKQVSELGAKGTPITFCKIYVFSEATASAPVPHLIKTQSIHIFTPAIIIHFIVKLLKTRQLQRLCLGIV